MNGKKNQTKNLWLLAGGILLVLIAVGWLAFNSSQPTKISNSPTAAELNSLSAIQPNQSIELKNNDEFTLSANIVRQTIDGRTVESYAYNDQTPGPLLKVKKGSRVTIHFQNHLTQPTTVHWHGLRLQNKFDGVPDVTQKPVLPGDSFDYTLDFPDEGLFWYHPHVREDEQQEKGLYGTILVEDPAKNESIQKQVLILDDVLLDQTGYAAFEEKTTNFAIMGRYGNIPLINGQTEYKLNAETGEPMRLYILNAANARPFRFAIQNTRLKIVGSDAGFYPTPFFADTVTLGPSERTIIEVLFDQPAELDIQNNTPLGITKIGTINVETGTQTTTTQQTFEQLTEVPASQKEIEKFKPYFNQVPDLQYDLLIRWPVMDRMMGGGGMMGGMMHHSEDGIEWEDAMARINEITTSDEIKWILRDPKTGKENMDLMQTVKKDDIKIVRLKNLETSSHPMQHPIHIHGNRFLILSENGIPNPNLVWKDTVLVPTGKTTDLLVDFSNPGDWMIHCHIAEHLGSGMMSQIKVIE